MPISPCPSSLDKQNILTPTTYGKHRQSICHCRKRFALSPCVQHGGGGEANLRLSSHWGHLEMASNILARFTSAESRVSVWSESVGGMMGQYSDADLRLCSATTCFG